MKISSSSKGCYTLVIALRKGKRIRIGKLGKAYFPGGIYLYTGSAMNGLRTRLSHHVKKRNKRSRWHIDYLLKSPETHIRQLFVYPGRTRQECRISQRILQFPGASVILKDFGASDCVSGCPSHLAHVRKKISPEEMREKVTKNAMVFNLVTMRPIRGEKN